jgi:hypothetical protein
MERILATTLINLPSDIIEIVKDYSFYNIEVLQRKRKASVVYSIQKAGEFTVFRRDLPIRELWGFSGYNEQYPGSEPQLQAMNCITCGEYKVCTKFILLEILINQNRLCNCTKN